MKVLQFFYDHTQQFKTSYERKLSLERKNTLIKGAKACGKKAFLCNFLSSFEAKEILFLDFEDLRFEVLSLKHLQAFLEQNLQIKILVFEHVGRDFCFDFSKLKNICVFVTSEFKDFKLKGFDELELDFLDFEEFISSLKTQNFHSLLSLFLQNGRSVGVNDDFLKAHFSSLELEILKFIALNLGLEFSVNELYQNLKQRLKISKDSLYKSVENLHNRYILHFVKHNEKNLKKVYFTDFAMKNLLSIKKDFKQLFENLVLSELFKFKEELFYDKNFDFILHSKKLGFICTPFLDTELIKIRAKKILSKALQMQIFHIIFITLSNEEIFYEQGVKFELISFEKWALGF
ncbi:DNA-binding protein [Campylobacter sp. MIT 99-7217]|uniref:ATP-binding protein n=1 Tax=Campylobacter sp. MIT 99-7217 TaxID=535091 RepID=UPI00115B2669|nr:ATP-binding protein [Campylobacter sp. MIT 99-7217]TQR32431.1 DNA-binding protein [Campylobacter sp. MIT 99-7217]